MHSFKQHKVYLKKLLSLTNNDSYIDKIFKDLQYNNINDVDDREYKSNVYDIENGDNFEDYAKEFYDYYKECFEDLYEDY